MDAFAFCVFWHGRGVLACWIPLSFPLRFCNRIVSSSYMSINIFRLRCSTFYHDFSPPFSLPAKRIGAHFRRPKLSIYVPAKFVGQHSFCKSAPYIYSICYIANALFVVLPRTNYQLQIRPNPANKLVCN